MGCGPLHDQNEGAFWTPIYTPRASFPNWDRRSGWSRPCGRSAQLASRSGLPEWAQCAADHGPASVSLRDPCRSDRQVPSKHDSAEDMFSCRGIDPLS